MPRQTAARRPTDRDSLRSRVLPFLLVSSLGALVALVPTGVARDWLLLGCALGDLALVVALTSIFTRLRHRRWMSIVILALSLAGVTLAVMGDGNPAWDLLPLVLLPVLWSASYGDYGDVVIASAGAVGIVFYTGAYYSVDTLEIV